MSKHQSHSADPPADDLQSRGDNGTGAAENHNEQRGAPDDLIRRAEEAEKKALLCQADLENFRRRKNRESAELLKYANLPLIESLLEVVDNLSRALESSPPGTNEPSSLYQGVEMVCGQLQTILENHGCVRIQALGQPFDPNLHEAIRTEPSDTAANTVIAEVQSGYKLRDRIVRPAKVIISTGPADS